MVATELDTSPDASLLTVDFANAFNEVSRAAIRAQLAQHLPSAIPYFDLRYGDPTLVSFGKESITCDEGGRQGGPWAPGLFSLALQPVLQRLQKKYASVATVRAFFDDVNIISHTRDVAISDLLQDISTSARQVGLTLRIGKSSLYAKNFPATELLSESARADIAALPVIDPGSALRIIPPSDGLTLLGTPIGSASFVSQACLDQVHTIARDLRHLNKIADHPQEYFLLLRSCFNTRPHYLARTVPPDLLEDAAKHHDHAVNRSLSVPIAGLVPPPSSRSQADWPVAFRRSRLPFAFGGLGIPSLQSISTPAHLTSLAVVWPSLLSDVCRESLSPRIKSLLASLAQTLQNISVQDTEFPVALSAQHLDARIQIFRSHFGDAVPTEPAAISSYVAQNTATCFEALCDKAATRSNSCQQQLTSLVSSVHSDLILRDIFPTTESRRSGLVAKTLSASCSEAVVWSRVVPTTPQFLIPPAEYLMLLAYYLHLPVPGRPLIGDRCAAPNHQLDSLGHHLMTCFHNRTPPHDALCDALHQLCRSAGLPARREPNNVLTHQAADCERRPDLAVENLTSNGRILLLDVTTADPAAPSHLREAKTHKVPAAAAQLLEHKKRQVYTGLFHTGMFQFQAVAMELPGRWSPSLSSLFKSICGKAKEFHGLPSSRFSLFVAHWRKRLSLAVAKSLAVQGVNMKQHLFQGSMTPADDLELSAH